MTQRPRFLMCPPEHFCVDYVINPWMEHQIGQTHAARAAAEWEDLRALLAQGDDIDLLAPQPGLPDMVFTANAGLELDGTVVVSRFLTAERRGEEKFFHAFFETAGFRVAHWPENVAFEGAGDALRDEARDMIWCGHGWRTSDAAPALLEKIFARRVVPLRLIDPHFYHLDTCFCPLSGGALLYYPAAFDAASREAIEAIVPPQLRIAVEEADARAFACNAVESRGRVVMNAASPKLRRRLLDAGFMPITTPLDEFMKAGGGAKCLTLRLGDAPGPEVSR